MGEAVSDDRKARQKTGSSHEGIQPSFRLTQYITHSSVDFLLSLSKPWHAMRGPDDGDASDLPAYPSSCVKKGVSLIAVYQVSYFSFFVHNT